MYMGRVTGINLYKHGIVRTYLDLDDEGNCYNATGSGCYRCVDFVFEMGGDSERSACNTGNGL